MAKPDGAPISATWVSSPFGKLLEDLEMPHIRFHDDRVIIGESPKGTMGDVTPEMKKLLDFIDGKEPKDDFTRELEKELQPV